MVVTTQDTHRDCWYPSAVKRGRQGWYVHSHRLSVRTGALEARATGEPSATGSQRDRHRGTPRHGTLPKTGTATSEALSGPGTKVCLSSPRVSIALLPPAPWLCIAQMCPSLVLHPLNLKSLLLVAQVNSSLCAQSHNLESRWSWGQS